MVRFPASRNTKIRFKVYISLLGKKEMLGDAERSLEQLLLYNHDIGGKFSNSTKCLVLSTMTVNLDIISPEHKVVGQLHFKIAAVLDGKLEDMAEAVQATQTQSVPPVPLTPQNVMADAVQPDTHSELSSPPLMVQNASQIVEAMDPVVRMGMTLSFSDTVSSICSSLKALQNLGDHLSEVSHRC